MNVGKILILARGEYDENTQYHMLDLVSFEGDSYLAKKSVYGVEPTDEDYWHKFPLSEQLLENKLAIFREEVDLKIEADFDSKLNSNEVKYFQPADKNHPDNFKLYFSEFDKSRYGEDARFVAREYSNSSVDVTTLPEYGTLYNIEIKTESMRYIASGNEKWIIASDDMLYISREDIYHGVWQRATETDLVLSGDRNQISLSDAMPFRFGIDADGNYGYYKKGSDTLIPF